MPRPNVPDHPAIALYMHSIKTQMNAVQFAHQLLGNPCISTLLKAVRRGFLHGCPNISKKLALKYLNPSPATVKGHMKRPHHGIRSTTPKRVQPPLITTTAAPTQLNKDAPTQLAHPPISAASSQEEDIWAILPLPNPIAHPTSSSMTNWMRLQPTYLHLGHLPTKTVGSSIMTLRGHFRSCRWTAAYVFSSYTTTNQTASWQI